MLFFAESLDVFGTVMIAYMAIRVHYIVRREHKIDERVLGAMRREQSIGFIGIFFVILAYFIKYFGGYVG